MAWGRWTTGNDDRMTPDRATSEHTPAANPPDRSGALPAAAQAIALDLRPTILIAAREETARQLDTWAERAGLRCIGAIPPGALAERLTRIVAVDMILVDLRGQARRDDGVGHGENAGDEGALDARAARMLTAGACAGRLAILTDLAGLDAAMARINAPEAEFLCEPQPADIVSLLVMAALHAEAHDDGVRFHDVTRDAEAARIDRLSEEVRRLAATIERLTRDADDLSGAAVMEPRHNYRSQAERDEAGPLDAGPLEARPRAQSRGHGAPAGADPLAPTPVEIRALLRARRLREHFLPADLFADPAWDMMLDLMAARLTGQRVSVSSLCIAAAVPPTTALRWIRQLTDRCVFARIDDPADGRRVFIELTDEAADALASWAITVRKNGGLLARDAHH